MISVACRWRAIANIEIVRPLQSTSTIPSPSVGPDLILMSAPAGKDTKPPLPSGLRFQIIAELTAFAIRDEESTHQSSDAHHARLNDAKATTANARVKLHEHADEHRCLSHSVYSALCFLWRNQRRT
jgi:hypothetical protein